MQLNDEVKRLRGRIDGLEDIAERGQRQIGQIKGDVEEVYTNLRQS